MQGKPEKIPHKIRDEFSTAWLAGAQYWPFIHSFNFGFVPLIHQPLVAGVGSVYWYAMLSHFTHKEAKGGYSEGESEGESIGYSINSNDKNDNDGVNDNNDNNNNESSSNNNKTANGNNDGSKKSGEEVTIAISGTDTTNTKK